MDTLIDKREFPKEMHQQNKTSKEGKTSPIFLIILIIIAVGVIVFLACRIFLKKDLAKEKQFYTAEEQVEVVNKFKETNLILTEQGRQEKIDVFFNN